MRPLLVGVFALWVLTGAVPAQAGEPLFPRQLPLPEALRAEPLSPFPRPTPPPAVTPPPEELPPPERPRHRRRHHHHPVLIVPSTVYVAVPRRDCWAPGYWTHQWVPTTSHVWVPEHWTANGYWVPGHYATVAGPGGHWRPVWIPDTWIC